MKNISKKVFVGAVVSMLVFGGVLGVPQKSEATIDGYIRITSPNGGEVYTVGDMVTITWDSSSNIDTVSIGYSSCPSCLDWIKFTTPNTGSYTWKVNVGNTSNTKFVIDIGGYETGKGSLSDRSDANFTVNPKSTPTPTPTKTPTPTPTKTPTPQPTQNPGTGCGGKGEDCYTPTMKPSSIPTATPTRTASPLPAPTVNSVTDVKLNQSLFYFEGSQTTRLSDIKDPSHVEDFTLDFRGVGYMEWTETIDLSTPEAISALQNINKYVEYDEYYFFIYYEFWVIWEVPVEVTFYNFEAVAEPTILKDGKPLNEDVKLTTPTPSATPSKTPATSVTPSTKKNITFKAKDAGKYTVQHAVRLESNEPVKTSDTEYVVRGTVSDPKANVNLTLNGQAIEGPIVVDQKTGVFEKTVSLILGHNAIAATATSPNGPVTPDDLSVTYAQRSLLFWIVTILIILAILAAYFLVYRRRSNA